jgi:hypothetical protein
MNEASMQPMQGMGAYVEPVNLYRELSGRSEIRVSRAVRGMAGLIQKLLIWRDDLLSLRTALPARYRSQPF